MLLDITDILYTQSISYTLLLHYQLHTQVYRERETKTTRLKVDQIQVIHYSLRYLLLHYQPHTQVYREREVQRAVKQNILDKSNV